MHAFRNLSYLCVLFSRCFIFPPIPFNLFCC
jgi:hypothetical protein